MLCNIGGKRGRRLREYKRGFAKGGGVQLEGDVEDNAENERKEYTQSSPRQKHGKAEVRWGCQWVSIARAEAEAWGPEDTEYEEGGQKEADSPGMNHSRLAAAHRSALRSPNSVMQKFQTLAAFSVLISATFADSASFHPSAAAFSRRIAMGKHARKKQRLLESAEVEPLGAVDFSGDEVGKDEEELRLESFLFGSTDDLTPELPNDQSLFTEDVFVDDGHEAQPSTSRKPSAWTDSDDTNLEISLTADKRRRKLRDALLEDTVDGRDYERRLRRQFEKINPTPEWATKARTRIHGAAPSKRRRSSTDSEPEEEAEESDVGLDALLAGTGSVLAGRRAKVLPHGTIAIERLRDANLSAKAEGEIKVVQFHPSPQVPVLLTASSDRRLRLYNVRDSDIVRVASTEIASGRRTYQPSPPNPARSIPSFYQCHVPPERNLCTTHRPTTLLLYLRPAKRRHATFSAGALGHNICELQSRCSRW